MGDKAFTVNLGDGRTANCWIAEEIEYSNCIFSAGLVDGISPDDYFMRVSRDGDEPMTIFLREDEVKAILYCLLGALWSSEMFARKERE